MQLQNKVDKNYNELHVKPFLNTFRAFETWKLLTLCMLEVRGMTRYQAFTQIERI